MKASSFAPLALIVCFLLSSCDTDSVNPLSSPNQSQADPQLLGDWRGKKNPDKVTFHFTLKKGAWMHLDIIPAEKTEKIDSYDFFPTVIGKNHFLNVVMTGKEDKGHPIQSYQFVRYTLTGDHMQMWMISPDVAADAVRRGKIKGTVHQVGQPPHPDVDVNLQDTSENLSQFIAGADVNVLFSPKLETLYRVKPVGSEVFWEGSQRK